LRFAGSVCKSPASRKGTTMKWLMFLLTATALTGCTQKSPTTDMANTAAQTVDAMYNSVPEECRTDMLADLRATAKEQIKMVDEICELQKDTLWAKIRERNVIIASLCLVILVSVGAGVFLKFRR
jgi:Tfp pilus assembly ATPase PilU